jgi:hypothetical protein
MERLCYQVCPHGQWWEVRTTGPWPDALERLFSTREEAVTIAAIAAEVEWKQTLRPTCVCGRDPESGELLLEAAYGESTPSAT